MRVLVTGGNGHLGYNLVKGLIAGGHAVRASVRSLADAEKTGRLKALGPVELVEARLERPDQLRAVMEGIEVLFHAAAVYSYFDEGREQEIMDAAVNGAEAALRAAADARVRKVVLTSSAVTVPLTLAGAPPSTEDDWTEDTRVTYIRAKTEAERRAWPLARDLGLNLVTVLPGGIGGPGFARNTPSLDVVEAMMYGAFRMGVPDANFPYVDVRDVVSAHVMVAEQDAQGRFLAINDVQPHFRQMLEAMRRVDPRVKPPLMGMPDFMAPALPLFDRLNAATLGTPRIAAPDLMATLRGRRWNASNHRAREVLGWAPMVSLEDSLRDTMAELRARREKRR